MCEFINDDGIIDEIINAKKAQLLCLMAAIKKAAKSEHNHIMYPSKKLDKWHLPTLAYEMLAKDLDFSCKIIQDNGNENLYISW